MFHLFLRNLKFRALYFFLGLCLIVLWSCAGGNATKSPIYYAKGAKPATTTLTGTRPPEYRIGILDELEIRFYYHERFNEKIIVRPDGRITLENVGDIYVAGITPIALDQLITDAYANIVYDPQVTVFVRKFASQSIYVIGEVDHPGVVEIRPDMTVLQALAAAGGPVSGARLKSVILLRRDESGKLNGSRLNMSREAIKVAETDDPYLLPQDVIFVPKTFIASVNDFLGQVYNGLLPPVDIYLRTLREYRKN